MPLRIRTTTATATAVLAVAFGLALAAQWFYKNGMVIAGVAAAAVALLTCCVVIVLCTPQVFRWGRKKRAQTAWLSNLTGEGLVFFPAMLFIAGAAVISGNNLMYLILSVMLAAMMLSGVVSRLSLADLFVRVFAQEHVFAGQPFDVEVRIKNRKRWMPSFSLRLGARAGSADEGVDYSRSYCPLIPGGDEVLTRIECTRRSRGVYPNPTFRLSTKFPFSVVERGLRVGLRRELVVYPRIDAALDLDRFMQSFEQRTQPARGTSHDLYRIRPALPEDGARFVDWKASARTDELQVREFNRFRQHQVLVVFDRRAPGASEAEFEAAVDRCATLLHALWMRGVDVVFRCGDFESSFSPGSDLVYHSMRFLATVQADTEPAGPSQNYGDEALVIGVEPSLGQLDYAEPA